MSASIRFVGEWSKFVFNLRTLKNRIIGFKHEDVEVLGSRLVAELRRNIANSPPPPLAESTVLKKILRGAPYPARSLYETGDLLKYGPELFVNQNRRKVDIEIVSGRIHVGSKMTYRQLLVIHEFGTKTIPPRPVLGPILNNLNAGKYPELKALGDGLMFAIQQNLTS